MTPIGAADEPVTVAGRFLFAGAEKLVVKGATYGTFGGPDDLPSPDVVAGDLRAMRAAGLNALRTYTVPPAWLLDLAAETGLRVLVGMPWQQHVTFLDSRRERRAIERTVAEGAQACAGHPAVLGLAIGNEIPRSIARWHGARRTERFLERLAGAARREAPSTPITYVNFPSTEYLELPFLDFVAFNVFLEERQSFERYLRHLNALAGDRPVVITELGLDSRRHGKARQAAVLAEQVRAAFAGGCAGAFAFSWTDEWVREGVEVDDWDFGMVDRQRRPKPALAAGADAFRAAGPQLAEAPPASVIVCSHNGARTLADCLDGLARLSYPAYETIVVDDGSVDATASIAAAHGARVISTPPRGLSAARNTGFSEAANEIVAFLDDDCRPDVDWLSYAVATLVNGPHAGVGGPNIPPPDEGLVARAVAAAPGTPTHVLASDSRAEHIAGCNMVFHKRALAELGGFDVQFHQAGDDVDMCWRISGSGVTLGFSPSAVVWHRRRPTVRAYLRQQRSYGHAEALLERKWPERHNGTGHVTWSGQVYGGSLRMRRRRQVTYGVWGEALFQPAALRAPPGTAVASLMPEWYLLLAALVAAAAASPWLSILRIPGWSLPLVPLLLVAVTASLVGWSVGCARRATRLRGATHPRHLRETATLACLVLLQPLARLAGRLGAGLTPWRGWSTNRISALRPRTISVWDEHAASATARLEALERELRRAGAAVNRGAQFDRWDLRVRVGALGAARIRLAIEEHGHGRQLLRYRVIPAPPRRGVKLIAVLLGICALEAVTANLPGLVLVGLATMALIVRSVEHCAAAGATLTDLLVGVPERLSATQLHVVAAERQSEVAPLLERGPVPIVMREL